MVILISIVLEIFAYYCRRLFQKKLAIKQSEDYPFFNISFVAYTVILFIIVFIIGIINSPEIYRFIDYFCGGILIYIFFNKYFTVRTSSKYFKIYLKK